MPVAASAVGGRLETHREELSVRRLLAYSAGLAATGDPTFDDDRHDGIVALPPFCVSLEWPVVSSPLSRELTGTALEESRRGVHASQDSFFHRPMRPGDRLETRGAIVGLEDTKAGARMTTKLETLDASTGEAVVTSYSQSIFRAVPVAGESRMLEPIPAVPTNGDFAGGSEVRIPISRQLPHVYTECAKIWNPIHTERVVALAAGLPDIILHGTATWALAGREIIRHYCDGDPRRMRRLHGRFRAMVIPGSEIRVLHLQKDDGVHFEVRNDSEQAAITHGFAEIAS
ncbi:MAG: MaoC/PaaZ C-terminal domain-containing protein [Acidobacteriota bacterium]|nr:MaoC/PaaZ C-terminal domain-containing protein [Acidobacteriota bacterium]